MRIKVKPFVKAPLVAMVQRMAAYYLKSLQAQQGRI
jgi:hypothetical protein